MKIQLLVLLVSFASACQKEKINLFPAPESRSDIQYTRIKMDSILMEHIESSYLGKVGITPDHQLYFIDTYYCYFFTFDTLGHFQKRYLGRGRAPHEVMAGKIAAHTLIPNNRLFLLGFQLDHYVYDSTFHLQKSFFLERNKSADVTQTSAIYTHQYDRIVCRNYKNKVYFNMYSEHPNLDYIEQTDRYMNKCRHISEIDIETNKDERMLGGGYPDLYKSDPLKYMLFSGVNFDIDAEGNFYVSYEADSVIYKYNHDYQPITSFGYAGKAMNTNYKTIHTYKECRKYAYDERETKGYYHWIQYINSTNLLFRSYSKGNTSSTDGLQIYKNNTLIADIDVPKTFKIAGYIAPYYYSQAIIDEEKETMKIYRFKL